MVDVAEIEPEVAGAETPAPATPAPETSAPAPAGATSAPTAPGGFSLDSMVVDPAQAARVQAQLATLKRAQMETASGQAAEMSSRLDTDRARLEQAYKVASTEPEGLEAWDSKKKSSQYYTDPVEAFGSIGSAFAFLAAGFAGLPMEHALNAGAAAINAIHAGDAKAYERDYESWKDNTQLALKRHDIQRQAYNDAFTLMNANINAGRTKMELAAAQFNDKKALMLLESGMDKEFADLVNARNKSAMELSGQWDKIQLEHEKVQDLRNDPRYTGSDREAKNQAIVEWTQRWAPGGTQRMRYDFVQDYIAKKKAENPEWTGDDLKTWGAEAATAQGDLDAGTTGKPLSSQARKSAGISEMIKKSEEEVAAGTREKPLSALEAEAEWNRKVATPSGNRIDDLRAKNNQADNILQKSEKILGFLRSYKGGAGLMGSIMRGAEVASNVTGLSTSAERAQFRRNVLELQDIVPQLLTDSMGRPLAAAQKKVDAIVAGLNAGDTGPNTVRAYEELIEDIRKRKQDYQGRVEGGYRPGEVSSGSGATSSPPPPKGGAQPWLRDPIKTEKRSSLEPTDISAARRKSPSTPRVTTSESLPKPTEWAQREDGGPWVREVPKIMLRGDTPVIVWDWEERDTPPSNWPK